MELILDTINGASVDFSRDGSKIVRKGIVTGIPAAARSDQFVLARAIAESGGPVFGEQHPFHPGLRVRHIRARAAGSTNDAELEYIYEGPPQPPSASWQSLLCIDDSTSLVTELEEVDRFGKVIQATFKWRVKATDSGYDTEREISSVKTGQIPVQRPRRRLTVSGFIFGRTAPSSWAREAQGYVNDSPWPTGSLWTEDIPDPRGYWLATSIDATTDRYYRNSSVFEPKKAPYKIRCVFESKVYRDWSHYVLYRNKYGNVPPEMAALQPDIAALIAKEYAVGQDVSVNGITKVGAYKLSPFPTVFGF